MNKATSMINMIGSPDLKKKEAFIVMISEGARIVFISSWPCLREKTFLKLEEKKSKKPDCKIKTRIPIKR